MEGYKGEVLLGIKKVKRYNYFNTSPGGIVVALAEE
jgi:hypothetical protein